MNKTGIAASLVLVVGAVVLGGAWYTGGQLQGVLQHSLERGDRQLQDALPGLRVGLELLGVERGLFSSQARYGLNISQPAGETRQLVVVDQIEHGPLPLSRLKTLKLWPVMAVSNFQLEESAALNPWFAANDGHSPLSGVARLDYNGALAGEIQLLPLKTRVDGHGLDFGGLDAEFEGDAEGAVKFAANLPQLDLELLGEQPGRVALRGVTLLSDRQLGSSGLYLGDSRLVLQNIEVALEGKPALALSNLVQTDRLQENGGQVSGQFVYTLEAISVDQRPLGSARMDWSMQGLDAAALKTLAELYRDYAVRAQADKAASLDAAQRAHLEAAVSQLLAGQPRVALNELSLHTGNGEGRLSLALTLHKPESFELPFEQLLNQLIASLDARVQVAKPMISDLILFQAALQPGGAPAATASEARAAADMGGEILSATRLARVEGQNILSELSYANGQVVLNGESLPLEQFLGLLLALAQLAQASEPPQAPEQALPE